jgi:hypothetical protein
VWCRALEILRNVLSGSEVGDRNLLLAQRADDRRERLRFIELGDHQPRWLRIGKTAERAADEIGGRIGSEDQMCANAGASAKHPQHLPRHIVLRRSASGIDQQRPSGFLDGAREFVGCSHNGQRCAEDVGIETQLFDGTNTEAVSRNEPESSTAACALLRGDLGDRGGLPHTGRANEHFDWRVALIAGRQGGELIGQRLSQVVNSGAATMRCRVRVCDVVRHRRIESRRLQLRSE